MTAAIKVLVIGGYGVFGGRLIQLLEDEPRLNLLVAGRSAGHASAFVRSRGNTAAELTMALCPHSEFYESAENDQFNFHVRISHPLTGPIVQYDGWLARD